MNYTVDYFIEKFSSIPEEKWGTNKYFNDGKYCALGHCGCHEVVMPKTIYGSDKITAEGHHLTQLFLNTLTVSPITINDGNWERYPQPTPKQRILAALYDIKKMQKKPKREKIKVQIEADLLTPPIPKEVERVDRTDAQIQETVLKNFYNGLKDVIKPK